jgi:hypothetical protein
MGTGLKYETFGDAFKRNKAMGEKEFEYKGKKYTTKTKEEAADEKPFKVSDISNSPRIKDMKAVSDVADKRATAANEARDVKIKGAQAKLADSMSGNSTFNDVAIKRAQKEVDEARGTASKYTKEAEKRQGMLSNSVADEPEYFGMKKGGKVSSASSRGDGIAQRGKTRGKVC